MFKQSLGTKVLVQKLFRELKKDESNSKVTNALFHLDNNQYHPQNQLDKLYKNRVKTSTIAAPSFPHIGYFFRITKKRFNGY